MNPYHFTHMYIVSELTTCQTFGRHFPVKDCFSNPQYFLVIYSSLSSIEASLVRFSLSILVCLFVSSLFRFYLGCHVDKN